MDRQNAPGTYMNRNMHENIHTGTYRIRYRIKAFHIGQLLLRSTGFICKFFKNKGWGVEMGGGDSSEMGTVKEVKQKFTTNINVGLTQISWVNRINK